MVYFSKVYLFLFFAFVSNPSRWIAGVSAADSSRSTASPGTGEISNQLEKLKKEVAEAKQKYETELKEWEDEKRKMEKFVNDSRTIRFNVGGEYMYISHGNLKHIESTTLGQMLLDKWTGKASRIGQILFLDFDPKLFRMILDQLRGFEPGDNIVFYPPDSAALAPAFNAMLEKLGLKPVPDSDDDVFTFNVGGEVVATKRKTLKVVPGSKLSSLLTMTDPSDLDPDGRPFLDYDPKLFRYLLGQLQVGQTTDFEAPDEESKTAFHTMLQDFGLKPSSS